jgi:threonine/homoserine/homoserine lactone efflux protein
MHLRKTFVAVTLVSSVLAGGLFGLALAAPPGPMNAVIAEESVLRGWGPGVKAGVGAMAADVLYCGFALLGLVAIVQRLPMLRAVMIAVGGVLMCVFAVRTFQEASSTITGEGPEENSRGFRRAFVLAASNPYQILFWLTIGVGLLDPGTFNLLTVLPDEITTLPLIGPGMLLVETGSPAILIGLYGGVLLWVVSFPTILVAIGERVDAATPAIATLSALVLGGFGIAFLIDAATRFGLV